MMTRRIGLFVWLSTNILSSILLLSSSIIQIADAGSSGFQSDIAGKVVASSIAFDKASNSLYITGTSDKLDSNDETSCFLATLSLSEVQWLDETYYGDDQTAVTCSAIAIDDTSIFTIGWRGKIEPEGALQSKIDAIVTKTEKQDGVIGSEILRKELTTKFVQIPTSIAVNDNSIFLASEVANDGQDRISLQVTSYNKESLELEWSTEFKSVIASTGQKTDVSVEGMVFNGRSLLIVGSTKGSGDAFGTSVTEDDMDGFMVSLDTTTGNIDKGGEAIRRSEIKTDDFLHGVCNDDKNPTVFYVVGSEMVETNLVPFVQKINHATMEAVWTRFLLPRNSNEKESARAAAISCKVWNENVYVAGNTENSSYMIGAGHSSYGSNDIFAANLATLDGDVKWMKQIGSTGKDTLAFGVGITFDAEGNVIVYGTTDGNLFRGKPSDEVSDSDVFVMSIDKTDGAHSVPFEFKSNSATATDGDRQSSSSIGSTTTNTATQSLAGGIPMESSMVFGSKAGTITTIIVGCLLFTCCVIHCTIQSLREGHKEKQRNQTRGLFRYLYDMDVADLDIRRSPAGGFHVSYLNDLAEGNDHKISSSSSEDSSNEDEGVVLSKGL